MEFYTVDAGGGMELHLVALDVAGGGVEIASAGGEGYSRTADFEELARESDAAAAVNGCFFDLNTGRLVGHVFTGGLREAEGAFGAAFAVTRENRPVIAHIGELGDPAGYSLIVTCVDILMKNGEVLVKTKADLVRNGHNPSGKNDIYKPARWSGVGIGRDGRVYFVSTPDKVSIYRFAREVRDRTPVADLLGLDGGSSSGFFFRGRVLTRPARKITSALIARPAERPAATVAEK